MYKRKGCSLWTITEGDYWFEQGYNNEEENLHGFKIRDLIWNKEIDLVNQFDVIFERYIEGFGYQRFLGYFKEIKVDDEDFNGFNMCNCAIFIVCVFNYLEGVEIVKEVQYVRGNKVNG